MSDDLKKVVRRVFDAGFASGETTATIVASKVPTLSGNSAQVQQENRRSEYLAGKELAKQWAISKGIPGKY